MKGDRTNMIVSFYPNRGTDIPIYMQLYDYFRKAISSGVIKKDEKLPSIREASEITGLSRTTVESAYFQLLTEGYVLSRPKSGYYAADLMEIEEELPWEIEKFKTKGADEFISREIYFYNEDIDSESFDVSAWKKIYGTVLRERSSEIYGTGTHQGEPDLRREISRFINLTRGARTNPEQIVVGAGGQYLIGILIGLIRRKNGRAAFEDPGYEKAKYIFEDYGFETEAIPVLENGIDLAALDDSHADIVYVSPSHQFPTGFLMPVPKRIELLAWARDRESFIIEDDYDSLIRYESRPVPCLQGLDAHDRVIYLGSFSKILLPSVRISYMVLPHRLLDDYEKIKTRYSQSASKLEQMTLAGFLEEGLMGKHVRRIKRNYKRKNALLQRYIEKNFHGRIEILSADSGLNMVLGLRTEKSAEEIAGIFSKKGILVKVIGRDGKDMVVSLAYSGFSPESLEKMIETPMDMGKDWLVEFL
ncbi:MAG: PLP-dependent aminotransferase family protein [Peptostreptococcaceae bacterium]|nr:PLP-dependent aminotransferase family protein [Peptostreptococcaceae bacterium]